MKAQDQDAIAREIIETRKRIQERQKADDEIVAAYQKREQERAAKAQVQKELDDLQAQPERQKEHEKHCAKMLAEQEAQKLRPRMIPRAPESPTGQYLCTAPVQMTEDGVVKYSVVLVPMGEGCAEVKPGEILEASHQQYLIDAMFNQGQPIEPIQSQEHLDLLRGRLYK